MFPFCFEWHWDPDHLIFLGLLYLALTIIGLGLTVAFIKTWIELPLEEEGEPPPQLSYRTKYSEY